ncbi:MAG: MATE family efflux transporter [Mycoplasma sp.]|nr:MATE family efflux transporter [Mycoplasma sp.]
MKTKIKEYFPKSKLQWKEFLMLAIPVIGGSLLFALNSFVDNFMVGHIKGATAGLFAVNSWTSIIMGIFAGTSATGSILVAQFYYSGNYEKVKEIAKIRFIITLTVAISFAFASWFAGDEMVRTFLTKPKNQLSSPDFDAGLNQGKRYIKYISFMWILIAITFNLGNMSRETGNANFPFIAGIFGLISNITLNYLTMRTDSFNWMNGGFRFETEGAAIATIAARLTVATITLFLIINKKLPIIFWPWKIFGISKEIQIYFWKRWTIFIFTSLTMVFITIRNKIYTAGYPSGALTSSTNPNISIGSADMLGLSWAIFGIISVVFNAINIIVTKFVGGELGKDNIKLAKENSKRIHGFMLVVTLPFILISILGIILLPYMSFLQNTTKGLTGVSKHTAELRDSLVLKEASLSMIALTLFLPWWNWFVTSKSCALSGGRVNLVSTIDIFTSGPFFLGWLSLVMIVIAPQTGIPFWVAYILGFLADIPRGIAFMWVYHKKEWAFNINKENNNKNQKIQ